ncbi:MAG TPA: ankyrin repeat domain-containing protein [Bryobacteraceae bacterium]|nr:ankyrin repeat domain-containing protein [Bryobacteraceae bacterium]
MRIPPRAGWQTYQQLAAALALWPNGGEPELLARWQSRPANQSAESFLAGVHGFASWPDFEAHIRALSRPRSRTARFEAAAEAIINGDEQTLARLLRQSPRLIRARSNRAHRSTLLHYISANGVEDERQKTPPNIVAIARLLLNAGAEVNALSSAYAGDCTALLLTATSCHPRDAGLQIPLLELLLAHGAWIERSDGQSAVNACLYNGRGEAAAFLARRGASLDIEGAAGVGRLPLVRKLYPAAAPAQRDCAFAWACQFGHARVADFLLDAGVSLNASLRHHGQTGLHWAASGGSPTVVSLLLARGAAVNALDPSFSATPTDWALYAAVNSRQTNRASAYRKTVALLRRAGGRCNPSWLRDPRAVRLL